MAKMYGGGKGGSKGAKGFVAGPGATLGSKKGLKK